MKKLLGTTASALVLALTLGVAATSPAAADTSPLEASPQDISPQDTSPQDTSIVRDPTEVPAPVARHEPTTVKIHLETIERVAELNDGSTYRFWTFNNQVPGPLTRVRVGDTVVVTMANHEESWMAHNVDFHAVTGPHGGGAATLAMPGESKSFSFKALKPGLYVYHCATPTVAQHIANGMYGMVLVEPEEGLPPVDREFYVMQGELYTVEPIGTAGELTEDYEALIDEMPSHYVFNGKVGGLVTDKPMQAKVGETVRLYFGVGGPNKTSSFHVIGEIFDRIYDFGSTARMTEDVQTVTVAPGGAVIADVTFEVPGTYVLVDHALSRVEKGLAAHIIVDGPDNPEVFRELPGDQLSMAE